MTKQREQELSQLVKKALNSGVSSSEILAIAKKNVYAGMLCIPKGK